MVWWGHEGNPNPRSCTHRLAYLANSTDFHSLCFFLRLMHPCAVLRSSTAAYFWETLFPHVIQWKCSFLHHTVHPARHFEKTHQIVYWNVQFHEQLYFYSQSVVRMQFVSLGMKAPIGEFPKNVITMYMSELIKKTIRNESLPQASSLVCPVLGPSLNACTTSKHAIRLHLKWLAIEASFRKNISYTSQSFWFLRSPDRKVLHKKERKFSGNGKLQTPSSVSLFAQRFYPSPGLLFSAPNSILYCASECGYALNYLYHP